MGKYTSEMPLTTILMFVGMEWAPHGDRKILKKKKKYALTLEKAFELAENGALLFPVFFVFFCSYCYFIIFANILLVL